MHEKEVRKYLNVIKRAVDLIEDALEKREDPLLEKLAEESAEETPSKKRAPALEETESSPTPLSTTEYEEFLLARKKHIQDLMAIDVWPVAIKEELEAAPTQEDQILRANMVLDSVVKPEKGIHFLDFGCGDGWIAKQILDRGAATSTAYDIETSQCWDKLDGVTCTHLFTELKRSFYDVVLLYDVLDHCENPVEVMKQAKLLTRKGGSIYVRCHPWLAKHGQHTPKIGLNKAHIHLFLNWEEMKELTGQDPMFTRTEKNPIEAYRWWFNEFDIRKEIVSIQPVSDFFYVESFKELLASEQEIPIEEIDDFLKKMEMEHVDYILTPRYE